MIYTSNDFLNLTVIIKNSYLHLIDAHIHIYFYIAVFDFYSSIDPLAGAIAE